nr:replication-associated recombination protein A [uncultured Peptostreptococcus sp.]
MPLADKYRPRTIDDIVGQKYIIGKGKLLNNMIESEYLPNMIFFGPPGVGKTTLAEIMASRDKKKFFKINASNSSIDDIKKVIASIGSLESQDGILLYIDEIQSFNKKQQQSILEFIENGQISLIASTTENPYHYVYKAILSRSIVIEFKRIELDAIIKGLKNVVQKYSKETSIDLIVSDEAYKGIANISGGDMRSSINILELAIKESKLDREARLVIDLDLVTSLPIVSRYNFDRTGDEHYNLLSALQKSIRGSDPDASIYYLARLIKGGDLISITRRLLVIACEDVGIAYPNAIVIVKSCVDSAMQVGLPEARIPLAQACLLLATAPKSNSAYIAIDRALSDIDSIGESEIPKHLLDSHYEGAKSLGHGEGYKYPHSYPNNYIDQQYLPDNMVDRIYYQPLNNKFEAQAKEFLKHLKR